MVKRSMDIIGRKLNTPGNYEIWVAHQDNNEKMLKRTSKQYNIPLKQVIAEAKKIASTENVHVCVMETFEDDERFHPCEIIWESD